MQADSSNLDVDRLEQTLLAEVASASDLQALEAVRVEALGRKGRITGLTRSLAELEPEARRQAGQRYNRLKQAVAEAIAARSSERGWMPIEPTGSGDE